SGRARGVHRRLHGHYQSGRGGHEGVREMNPLSDNRRHITRRALFGRMAAGIGTAALWSLLKDDLASAASVQMPVRPAGGMWPLPGFPQFAPKAKRVIYLFQNGAPSHVDLFDYKP